MKTKLLFVALMAIAFTQAQVSLVKDINPGSGDGVTNQFIGIQNHLLFSADNGTQGFELWVSDGTNAGTYLYSSLALGSTSSNPQGFYYWGLRDEVYFSASSSIGTTNYEPYRTKATVPSSIVPLGDINTTGSSYPLHFTGFLNNLYFTASDFGGNTEVYSTDGTYSGTGLFKEINSNSNNPPGSNPSGYTVLNGKMYFSAYQPTIGQELWVTDGTAAGTNMFADIYGGVNSSNPSDFTVFNNKLYFIAFDFGSTGSGRELWVTDGTVAGTQLVLDLNTGATSSDPENLIVFNNALYFTATTFSLGREVFKMSTLENITNLKNIALGSSSSNPANLFVSNGKLYFSADDGTNGVELWSSTGFSSTTNMVKDINISPSFPDSNPTGFAEYFGELYFAANDGVNGVELWKTDGTNAGTVLVDDINTSGDSNPSNLIVANNQLFFSANDGSTGIELWKYQDPSLSVNNVELKSKIALFPNPTTTHFTLETNESITKVSIYDVQGKLIKSFKQTNNSYNIEELTSGLYFVNIKTDSGEATKKLIKQ